MQQKNLSHILLYMFLTFAPCYAVASGAQPNLAIKSPDLVECQRANTTENIRTVLLQHADTLSPALINTTMAILGCADKHALLCNSKLTLIDYSLPSNQKRLWIFDLTKKMLLYHTYVSHGIKSGISKPEFFSNTMKSKTSSLGVFETEKSYYGRDGLSLRIKGLETHFNDHSAARSIVIHSA